MAETEIEITVARSDAASRTFAVTVPVERVRAAEAETTARYGKRAKVPGFRPGHVPAPIVRQRFGDAIRRGVLEELLRQTWERARSQEALKPIGDPQVRNVKFQDGAPLTFELTVEVKPEIALPRLGAFRLTRRVAPVTAEMVDAQLAALREQKAPWVPTTEHSRPGDLVQATIVNLDDPGEAAPEPVRFVLGQGRALPDLEARLMELDIDGAWEGTVRFPDDHPDPAKRGASRRLRVSLHEVKRRALPALDDEFARELGDFDSLAALRRAVAQDLEAESRREAEARLRAELLEHIAAANNVAVPPSLLERALASYAETYGIPEDQRARFAAEFQPVAEASARRELIVDAVADQAGLHATGAEVEARLAQIAAQRGDPPEAVRAALERSGRLDGLRRSLTDDKVFAYLLGLSAVEDAPAARSAAG